MLLSSRFHQCMWENVFCFPETRAASASVKHHERDQLAPQKITYHTFCTNGSKLVSYSTFYCFHNLAYFDQICCSNYVLFKRRLDDQSRGAWCVVFIFSMTRKHSRSTWDMALSQRVNFALYSALGWELHFLKEGYSAVNFVLLSPSCFKAPYSRFIRVWWERTFRKWKLGPVSRTKQSSINMHGIQLFISWLSTDIWVSVLVTVSIYLFISTKISNLLYIYIYIY